MSKIKCVIVDDELVAQRIIAGYLGELDDFEIVAKCNDAIHANAILSENQVDIIFLDIEMPKLNGFAFLKALKSPPSIIITTAHREFAMEGFDMQVVDYLLKPISFERFLRAVNKFKKLMGQSRSADLRPSSFEDQVIYVKSDKKTFKLKMSEIDYIESMNNYIIIHVGLRKHIVYKSLTEVVDELNTDFVRIHKSYVINRTKVKFFTKELVKVQDKELPIGKTFRDVTLLI